MAEQHTVALAEYNAMRLHECDTAPCCDAHGHPLRNAHITPADKQKKLYTPDVSEVRVDTGGWHTYVCVCIYIYLYMCTSMHIICIYRYVYIYICRYVYMYIHICIPNVLPQPAPDTVTVPSRHAAAVALEDLGAAKKLLRILTRMGLRV